MTDFCRLSKKHSDAEGVRRAVGSATLALLASSVLLLSSCLGQQEVDRRHGAHVERGRTVPPSAYAWYARARHFHRLGQLGLAREAYDAVLDSDPKSGAAWAGLASTYCEEDPQRAEAAFDKGLARAAETLPLHLARGHCELGWGKPAPALSSARAAFLVDPASPEASALLVEALAAVGQRDEATRVQRGQRLYGRTQGQAPPPEATRTQVDRALSRGDFALAEALSLELMTRSTLAARALALGQREYAAAQAALVALAAPADVRAWAVLSLTQGTSAEPPSGVGDLGELVTCLWAEKLGTSVGAPARAAFLKAGGTDAGSTLRAWRADGDPLLAACAARLEAPTSAPP